MSERLTKKLKQLPKNPGVYFHKDKAGEIIYVGKAAKLNSRVRQYFQKGRPTDTKTQVLVNEIADIDWIEVETEADALFLEAELIRRYRPKYNILARDDKAYVYVRINYDSQHPTLTLTRRPLDDKAKYLGPYSSALAVRRILKYLRRAFPYSTHVGVVSKRACLQAHLGLCPGLEEGKTSLTNYRANLRKIMKYLQGKRTTLEKQLAKEMNASAKASDFEKAAQLRDQLQALRRINHEIIFSDREFMKIEKDHALKELAQIVELKNPPKRIEGYDISHMSGTDNVASMVVFTNGLPDKAQYRKFKMHLKGNDDFAHMREVIIRRMSEVNRKKWGVPDLLLIDGGKGQLQAAITAMKELGLEIPAIGLAKRFETIILPKSSAADQELALPHNSPALKLLMRIRDEAHRFAVSYHSTLKTKRQTASQLDEIPGIGPATRKKLIKTFGSLRAVKNAEAKELAAAVGKAKADTLLRYTK